MDKILIQDIEQQFDKFEREADDFRKVPSLLDDAEAYLVKNPENFSLRRRYLSLIYRLELFDRLSPIHHLDQIESILTQKMIDWVYQYNGFNPDTACRNPHQKVLELIEKYPAYAELLTLDKSLRYDFFKWALRDNNEVTPFVYFVAIIEILKKSNLWQRTGYNEGSDLKLHTRYDYEGHIIRYLSLRMEGEDIEIANPKLKVQFRDGSERTIEEVFALFEHKIVEPGDLEFFANVGITYWPSYEPWKVVDFNDPEFWRMMPTLKVLSVSEAQFRYGKTVAGLKVIDALLPREELIERDGLFFIENDNYLLNEVQVLEKKGGLIRVRMRERIPVDGKNYIKVVRATKESDMSFLRTHGFGDVLIPMESGRYFVLNLGKYPKKFPQSAFKLIGEFVRVVLAVLQVPDDNFYFNHRNHTRECIGMSPKQGKVLMEIIRFLFVLARDDKLGFEFQTEGCAKIEQVDIVKLQMYLETKIDELGDLEREELRTLIADTLYTDELENFDMEHLPNFFYTSLEYVNPEGALGIVYKVAKWAPYWLQPYLVAMIFYSIGVWRGMSFNIRGRRVYLSHKNSPCWMNDTPYKHSLYHPGWLHYQQEQKGITLIKRKLSLIKLPTI